MHSAPRAAPSSSVGTTPAREAAGAAPDWPLNGTYGLFDTCGVAKGSNWPVPPPVRFAPFGCSSQSKRKKQLCEFGEFERRERRGRGRGTYANRPRVVRERAGGGRADAVSCDRVPEGRRAVGGDCTRALVSIRCDNDVEIQATHGGCGASGRRGRPAAGGGSQGWAQIGGSRTTSHRNTKPVSKTSPTPPTQHRAQQRMTTHAGIKRKIRERAMRQQPRLVLRHAVADLEPRIDLRRRALERVERVELRGGHGVARPVEQLVRAHDPHVLLRLRPVEERVDHCDGGVGRVDAGVGRLCAQRSGQSVGQSGEGRRA